MTHKEITHWLLEGDVSIQYQVYRDLLDQERPDLQQRISNEVYGAQFLSKRQKEGHWGKHSINQNGLPPIRRYLIYEIYVLLLIIHLFKNLLK